MTPIKKKRIMSELLSEVKNTISVHLTAEGLAEFKGSPYLRQNDCIVCNKIIDIKNAFYLKTRVRYYQKGMQFPKHAILHIPHRFVKCIVSDNDTSDLS